VLLPFLAHIEELAGTVVLFCVSVRLHLHTFFFWCCTTQCFHSGACICITRSIGVHRVRFMIRIFL
jgi:hypothetical protein